MNKEAYWRGFVKAASKAGLTVPQINYFVKRAMGNGPNMLQSIYGNASAAPQAGQGQPGAGGMPIPQIMPPGMQPPPIGQPGSPAGQGEMNGLPQISQVMPPKQLQPAVAIQPSFNFNR